MIYKKIAFMAGLLCVCGMCAGSIVWFVSDSSHGSKDVGKKPRPWAATVPIDSKKPYKVIDVIDGDTFKASIAGHTIAVRILGIDTPETVKPHVPVQCFGPEASTETRSLLVGKSVLIAINPDYDRVDKYGRLLAYVRLERGEQEPLFINDYLLKEGYAREYTFNEKKPYEYQRQFRDDEAAARAAGKGLWGKCQ